MPSDAWTDAERQLLQRAVRAVPEDLEKKARWTQIAVLVGGGRGRKECYEHWKALVAAVDATNRERRARYRAAPPPERPAPVRHPPASPIPARRVATERVRDWRRREVVLVVDVDDFETDSPLRRRDEAKEDSSYDEEFEADEDVAQFARLDVRAARRRDESDDELDARRDAERDTYKRPARRRNDSDDERDARRDEDVPMRRPRGSERAIARDEAVALRDLLLGDACRKPPASWLKQGFAFTDIEGCGYGLVQNNGGPCGVLAAVNACLVAELVKGRDWTAPSPAKREAALAKALAKIVTRCTNGRAVICVPGEKPKVERSASYAPDTVTECCRVWTVEVEEVEVLFRHFIGDFMHAEGPGCLLLLYSALLTRSIDEVRLDGDESTSLLDRHGYANQAAVNLLLTGRAVANVFDGNKQMDDLVLKGVHTQSDVGFLTLLEAYGHCSVGDSLKTPRTKVWVVYSESHYSLLVGDPSSNFDSKTFDVHYWDGLADQDEVIRLSVERDHYASRKVPDVNDQTLLIPPLDLVVRSKWRRARVDWNGAEAIL